MNPEGDLKLRERVLNLHAKTPIAHITAFPHDALLQQHLRTTALPHKSRGLVIDKRVSSWAIEMFRQTRESLKRAAIEEAYDHVFSTAPGQYRQRGLANGLHELCRDVSASWAYLDDRLREKLRLHLTIEDARRPVRVTLR
jgi:hypothetical protein